VKVTAWRIFHPRHAATAFRGEGAARYGGRWNSKGVPLIYAAGSQSLAALELLVHLSSDEVLAEFLIASLTFDASRMERCNASLLPADWRTDPAPLALRAVGDEWFRQARSAVLQVPSALVPDEANYLVNPEHPHFARIKIGPSRPFQFGPRTLKRTS